MSKKQPKKTRADKFNEVLTKELQKASFRGVSAGYRTCCGVILKEIEDGNFKTIEDVKNWCEQLRKDATDVQKVVLDENVTAEETVDDIEIDEE